MEKPTKRMILGGGGQGGLATTKIIDQRKASDLAIKYCSVHEREFPEHDSFHCSCGFDSCSKDFGTKHGPIERLISPHQMVVTLELITLRDARREAPHVMNVPVGPLNAKLQHIPVCGHIVGVVFKKFQRRIDGVRHANVVVWRDGHEW